MPTLKQLMDKVDETAQALGFYQAVMQQEKNAGVRNAGSNLCSVVSNYVSARQELNEYVTKHNLK